MCMYQYEKEEISIKKFLSYFEIHHDAYWHCIRQSQEKKGKKNLNNPNYQPQQIPLKSLLDINGFLFFGIWPFIHTATCTLYDKRPSSKSLLSMKLVLAKTSEVGQLFTSTLLAVDC